MSNSITNLLFTSIILLTFSCTYASDRNEEPSLSKLSKIPINDIDSKELSELLELHKQYYEKDVEEGVYINFYNTPTYNYLKEKEPSELKKNESILFNYLNSLGSSYHKIFSSRQKSIPNIIYLDSTKSNDFTLRGNTIVHIDSLKTIKFKSIGEPFMAVGSILALSGISMLAIVLSSDDEDNIEDTFISSLVGVAGFAWSIAGSAMVTFGVIKTQNDKKEFKKDIHQIKTQDYNTEFNLGITIPISPRE